MDKTTPVYKELRKFINTSWGSVGKDGTFPPFFPGPQPISIERRHMNLLNRNEYFACEKTDGTRIALVCCTIDGKKLAVTVNRAMEMERVTFCFPRGTFDGTILDGEMVTAHDGSTYLMLYDAVIVSGQDLRNMNLMDRLSAIDRSANGVMRVPSDAFQIKLKKFYYMKHMKYLVEMLKNNEFSYATDGVVFTPVYEPIRIGTHDTMFKWKPQEKNTVDFKVKNRPNGEIGLYIQERGELVFESLLKVCNITPEWGKMLHDDAIAECEYQWKQWPRWWKPVGIRTDKTHPNNRRTLHRTMVNIEENIQLHEFIQFEKRG
jgi:hypothetical protein